VPAFGRDTAMSAAPQAGAIKQIRRAKASRDPQTLAMPLDLTPRTDPMVIEKGRLIADANKKGGQAMQLNSTPPRRFSP